MTKRSMQWSLLVCSLALCSCIARIETGDDMGSKIDPNKNIPITGWGTGATINPPGAAHPRVDGSKSYSLQCTLTPSQVFTVQFTIGPPDDPESVGNKPVAVISWAVNGVTVRRKVSAVNGVSLTGVGESVKVVVSDDGNAGSESPYPSSTTVALGTRGGTEPPTLQNQDAVHVAAAGGTGTIFIEQNVGVVAVRLLAVNDAGAKYDEGSLTAIFRNALGTEISGFQNFNVNGFVQVPPGATEITLKNVDASTAVDVFPVFAIDG